MTETTLTFSLHDCLLTDESRAEFISQITVAAAGHQMPKLCLTITPLTTDKDVFQAIQIITGINKFLDVQFQLVDDTDDPISDHPARGYLKICQSWLPNATVVM